MTTPPDISPGDGAWDPAVCLALIGELEALRQAMLTQEAAASAVVAGVHPHFSASVRNLLHYLTLRQGDLRDVQHRLSWLGLSSLSHAESHTLANLNKVIGLLHRLTAQPWQDRSHEEPTGSVRSHQLLEKNARRLLGAAPKHRAVRIMVTLPREAADDAHLVQGLVQSGMDVARINCAHDDAAVWQRMARQVRDAAKAQGREVRLLFDLAGPKLRTGRIAPGPTVLKLRPQRDHVGHTFAPALLRMGSSEGPVPEGVAITVDPLWFKRLKPGKRIDFVDARGAKRHLLVEEVRDGLATAQTAQTAYLVPTTELVLHTPHGKKQHRTRVGGLRSLEGAIHVAVGDVLRVTRDGIGQEAAWLGEGDADAALEPAHIPCTLPEVVDQVRSGERIWFDDGHIGGVVQEVAVDCFTVAITHARAGGQKLCSDKGINLPDTSLQLPSLTAKDREDLVQVAPLADMVGLSFVQQAQDVHDLIDALDGLQAQDVGIVLKIETAKGFANLPELMMAAMRSPAVGVMIARGDLAVECGFERMAEVQEEILWCAESAHIPVIWATQVLDTLARTGQPSRAEISDAALSVRAECVMLNKGPFIQDAMAALHDILSRMQSHQTKKKPLLRALKAWTRPTVK